MLNLICKSRIAVSFRNCKFNLREKTVAFFLSFFLLTGIGVQNANAQVTVSGSTGADGSYTTLTNVGGAFAAINGADQTGKNIVVTITASSTAEAGMNSLNAGTWSTLKMFPTISGLEISGIVAAPLINLNGADNVTIDGRVNEAGVADLIISNTSTAATASTSTIQFITDASNNTIKYCTLKGSSTANNLAPAGIILFSTTSGTTGNDNNTITNNNITNAGSNRPTNVIYSAGTNLKENSGNVISDNHIFDFLNPGFASNGIQLNAATSATTISGNSFYETDTFVPTSINAAYNVIYINTASANISISNNFIGGTSPNCGSLGTVTSWTKTSGAANTSNNVFTAINVAPNFNASIQGNTIRNFSFSNSGAASWSGISATLSLTSSSVNIGTSSPNIIGDATGTGSITITGGATGTNFYGIYVMGAYTMSIENNIVGSVTVAATGPTLASNFCGIYNGASGTINNNTIGSLTTANSINASSASSGNAQSVYGIQSAGSRVTISGNSVVNLTNGSTNSTGAIDGILVTAGSSTISYNTVKNISSANSNLANDYLASVGGVVINNTVAAAQTIIGNTISGLTNTNGSFAGSIIGLYFNSSATVNAVSGNFIHSLSAGASSAANLSGIKINTGTTTYSNNIINLGDNSTAIVYGIHEAGGTNSLYFNTVYIGGSPTGALPSYALFAATTGTLNFRNNILSNARSSASGTHYAISLAGAPLTIDYNDYFTSGTGGVLGSFAAVDKTALVDWQTSTTMDAASLNTDPLFASAGGITPENYVTSASLPGVTGTGVLVDFNESARTSNVMGAIESASAINTVDIYSGVTLQASYPNLVYAFNAINNGTHTGALTVKINGNQYLSLSATLNASGSGTSNYSSVHIYPTVSGLSIRGDIADSPLIDLNGADNVTIDGTVNETGTTKDLIINNTSISSAANTSTIRLINDASNNVIRDCIIKGAETSTTSGILFFSTTNRATGNDSNLIENNDLSSSSDLSRPMNVIYSAGLVASGFENSGNTINANNIYDFFSRTGTQSNGVHIFASSTGWTISGNSFYETTAFAPIANVEYNPVIIRTGGAFDITGNFIGGSSATCGGAAWTKTASNTNAFFAINYYPATSSISAPTFVNIQGNTIQNFAYANLGSNSWTGIFIGGAILGAGGTINIGTTSPNIIGAATGNNSITFTSGATNSTLQGFYGINITHTQSYYYKTVNVQNNIIGSIKVANTFATGDSNFWGIYKTIATSGNSDVTNITDNTIGSTVTANSIHASTASNVAQTVYGIWTAGNATFTTTISGNIIANMSNASVGTAAVINGITVTYLGASATVNTGATNIITGNTVRDMSANNSNSAASSAASVSGIAVNVRSNTTSLPSNKVQTITGNTIFNLKNTNSAFSGNVIGIYFGGSRAISTVSNNFIHSLFIEGASSAFGKLNGIYRGSGSANFTNNIINIGGNSSSYLYGIYEANITVAAGGATSLNYYFNTINIGGSQAAGTTASYGLYGLASASTRDYRNNLFINTRFNSGTSSGIHYGIYLNAIPSLIDNNNYYALGTGTQLGLLGTTNATTLAQWKVVTGKDLNSVSVSPGFPVPSVPSVALDFVPTEPALISGATGTAILTDYAGTTRAAIPTMGAYEIPPVAATWTGTVSSDWNTPGNWSSASVPSITTDVIIAAVPNELIINMSGSSPAICNNLTINDGALIIINPGMALTVKGTLTNNATDTEGIDIESDNSGTGSLIAGVVAGAGTAIADRYMTTGAWHMVSSPLSGQTVQAFLSDDENSVVPLKNGNRGMMDYNPSANTWNDFFTDGALNGNLGAGRGFSMRVDPADAKVRFSGLLQAGPQSATTIDGYWNVIGNPYTSAIGVNTQSRSTGNFLNVNSANLDPGFGAVYVWEQPDASNGQTGKYTVYSNASTALEVQQGQAFFVKMKTGVSTVNYTSAMQLHNTGLALKSATNPWPTIKLETTVGSQKNSTIIAFNGDMTKGLDLTYDAGLLKGSTDLIVYSKLVEDKGLPLAIQALPDYGYSTMIIPIGLDFKTGGEVVFSAQLMNLPVDCKVILEDKVTKKYTDLSKDVYKVTVAPNSVITDRFQLHSSDIISGLDQEILPGELTAFSIGNVEIRIVGEVGDNAVATLYDIQGKAVIVEDLFEGNLNVIPIPNVKSGLYLLSVKNNGKLQSFKILIRAY